MKKVITFVIILIHAAAFAQAIIPDTGFQPGWKRSGKLRTFTAPGLFQHINGGADLFLEFGFDTLFVQRFKKRESDLGLEIYRMKSAESALGVYLLKCGRETPLEGIAARCSYDPFQTTLLKGAYFIQISNYDGETSFNPVVVALANTVVANVPAEEPDAGLMNRLHPGYVKGTMRLIRGRVALEPIYTFGSGDILNLQGKIYAVMAEYKTGSETVTRIFIHYPDEKSAIAVMSALDAGLDPYLTKLESSMKRLLFRDFNNRFGLIRRSGSELTITLHMAVKPEVK